MELKHGELLSDFAFKSKLCLYALDAANQDKDGHGEALAAWHMRHLGFSDAVPHGCLSRNEFPELWDDLRSAAVRYVNLRDAGVDVVSTRACAQVKCKWRRAKVPRADVSQLLGDIGAGKTPIFYAIEYGDDAVTHANDKLVALFKMSASGTVEAVNDAARKLEGQRISAPTNTKKRPREADVAVTLSTEPVHMWSRDAVAAWLSTQGLGHYAAGRCRLTALDCA